MSEQTISTCNQLSDYLQNNLSPKRYIHSLGVAQTTEKILNHYELIPEDFCFGAFQAARFCGLAHDIAREKTGLDIFEYCKLYDIFLDNDELHHPVLAHGAVSAHIARRLCGNYPSSWYRAISIHTTGDKNMDCLSLALFCADFIEPSRTYIDDDKRAYYLSFPSLEECAYTILCDMMKHWMEKTDFKVAEKSFLMKSSLEEKICRTGR